jgi:hypothetical protein
LDEVPCVLEKEVGDYSLMVSLLSSVVVEVFDTACMKWSECAMRFGYLDD